MPHTVVAENHGSEPVNLYYEIHGSGPQKILFIGGFGNICHQWDLQVDYFSAISDYSVCIFDNRGSGLSSSPKGRYKTSEMAMDAQDLVNQLGWEKFHLVGLSMGGMIAQELAHLCRHRLLSLTLESTYAYFNGLPTVGYQGLVAGAPKGERSVESFAAHVVNNLLFPKAWLDEGAPEGSGCATNRDQMIKFVVDRFSVVGLQDPQGRANQQVACMTHWMSTKRLTEIRDARFPVLVMTGTDDNVLIQPSSSIYLASILGGRLEVFEGGGHALRLQYPIRHNALLHNHLKTSWRIFTHRQKDAIMASLAAGHHSTNSQRSTVVWGGEASHDRGWVEEKDPTFPDLAVERHIVEEVEFAEHLLLPSRRTRESVATISTTTSVRSSTVSPQPLPCSPLLAVPEPVKPRTTLGILYSYSKVLYPAFLARPTPNVTSQRVSRRASVSSSLSDDEDDQMDYATPSASIYVPSEVRKSEYKEAEGGEGMEVLEEQQAKGWVKFVGSSMNFGFGDFVSMIPGTPT